MELVTTGDESDLNESEGWEIIDLGNQRVGVLIAYLEEKCAAFDTLITHCAMLGARFAMYLPQTLELALSCLNFAFHDGVREACAL